MCGFFTEDVLLVNFLRIIQTGGKGERDMTPIYYEAPFNRHLTPRRYLTSLTSCLVRFLYETDLPTEATCSEVSGFITKLTPCQRNPSENESSWGRVGEYWVYSELIRQSVLWTFSGSHTNEEVNSLTDDAAVKKFACGFKCEGRQRSSVLVVLIS